MSQSVYNLEVFASESGGAGVKSYCLVAQCLKVNLPAGYWPHWASGWTIPLLLVENSLPHREGLRVGERSCNFIKAAHFCPLSHKNKSIFLS